MVMDSKQGLTHHEQAAPQDRIARSDDEVGFLHLPFLLPLTRLQIERDAGEILLTLNHKEGEGANITNLRLANDGRVRTFTSGSQLTCLHV